jgi:DNA uptake protein ComE-like DNA-binding protein
LQLWASENSFPKAQLAGIKVAEMAIVPMFGGITASACCAAVPPAGSADQVLALALVCGTAEGPLEVRDLGVYDVPENFCQPSLLGEVRCTLADGLAQLSIEAIANPRAEDNLSGTLALEVWALDAPYGGGGWTGSPVASVIVGILAGGNQWNDCQFAVPAALPASGAALTVMLREWTRAGYVTRDYRNFAAAPVKAKAAPKAKAASKAKAPAKPAAVKPVATKPVAEAKAAAPKAAAVAKPVSINKASEDELAALKGLPREVAKAIVAGRPYAALEDVCKAKGMGAKKLEKLRALLSL